MKSMVASIEHAHDNAVQKKMNNVKETVPIKLFNAQSSTLKCLQKKWGGQGHPKCPTSDGPE